MDKFPLHGRLTFKTPTARVLDYFGDSTVYGQINSNTRADRPAPSYVDLPGYTVNNKGLNGDSTDWVLSYHADRKGWIGLLDDSSAHAVIGNWGINDRNAGMSIATYKANLRMIADIAGDICKKRLIFETPNPVDLPSPSIPMADYAQAMRDVAIEKGLAVIDQFAYLTQLIGPQPITSFMPDGAHPSPYTLRLKGEFANRELFNFLCGG